MIACGTRRIEQRGPVIANRSEHPIEIGFQQTDDKGIGMLRLKGIRCKPIQWEIPQIVRHNNVGLAVDRRRQHVAVARVGQIEVDDNGLMSRHNGTWKVFVHERPGPAQDINLDVGTISEKARHPLVVDGGAPQRRIQTSVGKTKKQVTKAGTIKDVGVEQRRQQSHCLLQAKLLVASRHLVQRLPAAGFRLVPIGRNILGPNAALRPHLAGGDPPIVEQLHFRVRRRQIPPDGLFPSHGRLFLNGNANMPPTPGFAHAPAGHIRVRPAIASCRPVAIGPRNREIPVAVPCARTKPPPGHTRRTAPPRDDAVGMSRPVGKGRDAAADFDGNATKRGGHRTKNIEDAAGPIPRIAYRPLRPDHPSGGNAHRSPANPMRRSRYRTPPLESHINAYDPL